MEENIKLTLKVSELEKTINELSLTVKELKDGVYKTSDTDVINRKFKFLQKVYDKNGTAVIN